MTDKKLKLTFAPGVLEQLESEMGPEELQTFLNELKEMTESGDLVTQSSPVDMEQLRREDPQTYEQLVKQLDEAFDTPKPSVH